MQPNHAFAQVASGKDIQTTAMALRTNGFTVHVMATTQQAREKVLELIPLQAEVMTMTSVTLETLGLVASLNESGQYDAIRPKLNRMGASPTSAKRKLAAAPDWVVGSVHALTRDGHVFIASNTGSQLATYAYTAGHVVWVVGAQKIVANDEQAIKRIYEYCLPLENERALQAYGRSSHVSKILTIKKEVTPQRATIIIVSTKLGF